MKHLQSQTINKVLDHFSDSYRVAQSIDDKADVTDLVKLFLGELDLTNEQYNTHWNYYNKCKEDTP